MSALPMPEAPEVDDAIYPDEYIERWGDRYVEGGFCYRGITFMQFLARPFRYLNDDCHEESLPLLPRQRRVRNRLIEAELAVAGDELLDLVWRKRR